MIHPRWPLLAYLVIALLYTLPLSLNFITHVPGDNGDSIPNLWPFWYFPHALLTGGGSLYHSPMQFCPDGISMVFASNSMIGSLLMAPVSLLVSPAAALNTWLILHLWLGGWFFFRFCQVLGATTGGAFLGGFVYMCSPFVAVHLPGHYTLVQIGFTSGALFSLAELIRRCTIDDSSGSCNWLKPSVGLGLCAWAVAATDFYLALMTVGLLLPTAAVHLLLLHGPRVTASSSVWKGFAVAVVLAVIMLVLWIIAVWSARQGNSYQAVTPGDSSYLVARWTRLVSLPQYHPVWRTLVYDGDPRAISIFNEYTYLGVVGLVIAFVGCLYLPNPRRMLPWAVAFFLALGLSGANRYSRQPAWSGTPLAFGQWWPTQFPFGEFRVPSRWQFALCAILAVGVAMGSDALVHRFRRFHALLIQASILGLLAFDLLRFPLPLTPARPLQAGISASQNGTTGAVLDVPVGIISGQGHRLGTFEKETLLRQMKHGRPILSANVSRLPNDLIEKRKADPELMAFLAIQDADEVTTVPDNLDWPGFRNRYDITVGRIPLEWPTSAALQSLAGKMNSAWRWRRTDTELIGE